MDWISCADRLPPVGALVRTKVDDGNGGRYVRDLVRHRCSPDAAVLWYLPDRSGYVCCDPTHWRPVRCKLSEER